METAKIAKPISGDKLYQKRARAAFPLLIRQAQAHTPIYYSDLARELGMPNPRNLNYVLGSIGQALKLLSREWDEEISPIQCLVINKNTGLPGEGIGWFITDKTDFRKLSRKQQRLLLEAELQKTYSYRNWTEVLKVFGLKPAIPNYRQLLSKASEFRGGGESEQHKRLKYFVAQHPEVLSLPKGLQFNIEFPLPSGDSLDVIFMHGDCWVGVEVKSKLSDIRDLTRGLFQCVKYRVLIEAHQAVQAMPQSARAVLVLEDALPAELVPLKHMLGVEVVESVRTK